ncbi:unnamed protein product [Ascophyllum nodosum]
MFLCRVWSVILLVWCMPAFYSRSPPRASSLGKESRCWKESCAGNDCCRRSPWPTGSTAQQHPQSRYGQGFDG